MRASDTTTQIVLCPVPNGGNTVSLDSHRPTRSGQGATGARPGPTRRQALIMSGASAETIGAAVSPFVHLLPAGAADGDESPEIVMASSLIGIELAAADLYASVGSSAVLDSAGKDLAAKCRGNHNAQGSALGEVVTAAGATVPTDANAAFEARYSSRIAAAGDAATLGNLFAEIENGFAATYLAGLETMTSPSLAGVAAQILATDATQAVVWSALANGQGATVALPAASAVPQTQTTDGQFDLDALTPPTTTTTVAATTTTEAPS